MNEQILVFFVKRTENKFDKFGACVWTTPGKWDVPPHNHHAHTYENDTKFHEIPLRKKNFSIFTIFTYVQDTVFPLFWPWGITIFWLWKSNYNRMTDAICNEHNKIKKKIETCTDLPTSPDHMRSQIFNTIHFIQLCGFAMENSQTQFHGHWPEYR